MAGQPATQPVGELRTLDDTAKSRIRQQARAGCAANLKYNPGAPALTLVGHMQTEFYFSDSNAPRDKFLFSKIQDDPEGYVDLALLCSFTRMQALLFSKTVARPEQIPDEAVTQAAAALEGSTELELSGDRKRVRRVKPLDPEMAMQEVDARSLYAAPFPFDITLDGMMQFWGQVAPTRGVRLRRHTVSLDFRGSIFVEFEDTQTMEQVLGKKLEHAGAPLQLERKTEFLTRKTEERRRKAEEQKAAAAKAEADGTAAPTQNGGHAAEAAARAEDAKAQQPAFIPGSVLRVTFAGEEAMPAYQAINQALGGRDAGVRFTEMLPEESTALVRFGAADEASAALGKATGQEFKVGERTGTVALLEGQAEQDFAARQADKFEKAQAAGGGRGRGRKRLFDGGARGGSRGRGRGRRGRG